MLISDSYKEQQKQLHIDRTDYGVASIEFAPIVTNIIDQLEVGELLDYGCGKGRLSESIAPKNKMKIWNYDPGIEGLDELPEPCTFVTCIDVLEHIEPELLDNVLDDLQRVTLKVGYFTVHTGPAAKKLPDGRNAHLIQQPYTWWLPKIWTRFEVKNMTRTKQGFTVLVEAKKH